MIGAYIILRYLMHRVKLKNDYKKTLDTFENKEMECTCEVCGHFWCYNKNEVLQTAKSTRDKYGQLMSYKYKTALAMQVTQEYEYLDRCPGCGSTRITKKTVELRKEA